MKSRMRRRFVLAVAAAALASGPALAAELVAPTPADPTPEQRHEMAEVHQRLADCLVSTRPMAECRGEMQTSCQELGKDGCPMMEGGMNSGMMGGGMMQGQGPGMKQEAPTPAPAPTPPSDDHEQHH